MEYVEAIEKGFDLYDRIENEIRIFGRTNNSYVFVNYSDGILKVEADCRTKNIEAKVEIRRDEIYQRVLSEDLEPKDAICKLLVEKICVSAQDIR